MWRSVQCRVGSLVKHGLCVLFMIGIFFNVSYAENSNERLVLIQGNILYAYFQGRYEEIKRAELFYGYGFLDKGRVFIAYQDPAQAAAVAVIDIVDAVSGKTTNLTTLGGVGESRFDVNPTTKHVAYSDSEGIHLIKINDDNSFEIQNVSNDAMWGVFWIDAETIGGITYSSDLKTFKKIHCELPPVLNKKVVNSK